MWVQIAIIVGQLALGKLQSAGLFSKRPSEVPFDEVLKNNQPSEIRPLVYAGGTIELTPTRIHYGDYKQRAVERDSHWSDYIFLGPFGALLDFLTVGYRFYASETFALCYGPDAHVQRITIDDRPVYQAALNFDNAGSGFLIDDPQAWGGDQPPGEGGQYSHCVITRGNYTDSVNTYLQQILGSGANKVPSLRGVSALISYGPSGPVPESGYFAAGGLGYIPRFREWKVTIRRQPDNLATGFNKIGRHMNPMETIYEWCTSIEYGARVPLSELNLDNMRENAETLHTEGRGWSGRIESATHPGDVIDDILKQIDAVKWLSPSLGLGFRLIRRDYSFGSLRVLDKSSITRVERFSPGTYEDTNNKVQVQFPDNDDNFEPKPALYIDPANQQITGRVTPQTHQYLGVADIEEANTIATRDGLALSLPRAPLECFVFPSWGRLAFVGEVVIFEWSSPSFSLVMRVQAITPNGSEESDYHLVLIEDQFASGLRTFGEPVGGFEDPGEGLDTAPPSATWNEDDFPPDGLIFTLTTLNTNQFQAMITGGIVFGGYAPGGQYARIYVTEPGGVQTLSPLRLVPDTNNEATFPWPGMAAGTYEFCVQTFSLRDATNGVKICAEIEVAAIGSPSPSPSASISPSSSVSRSPSPSASQSPSASVSPSASQSPSSSISPSSSVSASTSPSVSPSSSISSSTSVSASASTSPSSSASPSGLPELDLVFIDGSEHVLRPDEKWKDTGNSTAPVSGITGMDGKCYDDQTFQKHSIIPAPLTEFTSRFDLVFRDLPASGDELITRFIRAGGVHLTLQLLNTGAMTVSGPFGTHTTTDIYAINTKYEIEFYGLIDNAGAYRLMVDDVVPNKSGGGTMDQSGIDTQDGATANFTDWDCGDPTINTYTDNHALASGNNPIGPGQVETLYPNGAGDLAQLTRGGADSGANWSQCDEAVQNGNTDYVVTTVNGSTFKNQLRIGGVNYDGATTHTGIANYKSFTEMWNLNPATSAAWTDSDIDGLQAGILGIDANERDVYTFQNRSITGTPRAVQVTTTVNLTTSRLRMSQVVVEVWITE